MLVPRGRYAQCHKYNGRAQSTLTLGPNLGTNTVQVSAAGIQGAVTFHAISDTLPTEYLWSVPSGTSLIHGPLKVTTVDGVPKTTQFIADLYDALGGADTVNLLVTDLTTQGWRSYVSVQDRGTAADATLTDDKGIITVMKAPASLRLGGDTLGTNGTSAITLHPGMNLVGVPLRDSRIPRVSDLFALEGIGDNVFTIIVSDNGAFQTVGQAGDAGDIEITGGQSFILTAQRPARVTIFGTGWYNISGAGIQVTDTTPVLALRGSIVSPVGEWDRRLHLRPGAGILKGDAEIGADRLSHLRAGVGFRVTVKNLSTGRKVPQLQGRMRRVIGSPSLT